MLLRVKIDGGRYLGFVEIHGTTNLAQVRSEISTSFDSDLVPLYYQFLAPFKLVSRLNENNTTSITISSSSSKGNSIGEHSLENDELVPVGTRRETTFLARHLLPSISLLPVSESPIASGICVDLWTCSHRFRMWALPTCEIKDLREEASRFWHLNPSDTLLVTCERSSSSKQEGDFINSVTIEEAVEAAVNGDFLVWPDTAKVHKCLSSFSKLVSTKKGIKSHIFAAYKDEDDSKFDNENEVGPQPVFSLRMKETKVEKLIDARNFQGKIYRKNIKEDGEGKERLNIENVDGKSTLIQTSHSQSQHIDKPQGHYLDPDLYSEIYNGTLDNEDEGDSGSATEDIRGSSTRSLLTLGTGTGGNDGLSKRRNLMKKALATRTNSNSSAALVSHSSSSSSMMMMNTNVLSDNTSTISETMESDRIKVSILSTITSSSISPASLPVDDTLSQMITEEKISTISFSEKQAKQPSYQSSSSTSRINNFTSGKRKSVTVPQTNLQTTLQTILCNYSGPLTNSFYLTVLTGLSQIDANYFSSFASIEPALWRTFAKYAVSTGGTWSESRRLRLRQWRLMLDDSGLLLPSCATTTNTTTSSTITMSIPSVDDDKNHIPTTLPLLSTEAADLIFYSNFSNSNGGDSISLKNSTGSGIEYFQFLRCLIAVSNINNINNTNTHNNTNTGISRRKILKSTNNGHNLSRINHCFTLLGETSVDSLACAMSVVALMLSTPSNTSNEHTTTNNTQHIEDVNNNLVLDKPSVNIFLSLVKDIILKNCTRFNAEDWSKEVEQLTSLTSQKATDKIEKTSLDHITHSPISASGFILSVLGPALRPVFSSFALSCATTPSLAIHHSQSNIDSTPIAVTDSDGQGIMSMDVLREREKVTRLGIMNQFPLDSREFSNSSPSKNRTNHPHPSSSSAVSSPGGGASPGGASFSGTVVATTSSLPGSPLQKQISRLSLASQGLSPNSAVTRAMISALNGKQPLGGDTNKQVLKKKNSRNTLEPPSAALSRAYATQVVNSRRQTVNGHVEGGYASRQLHQQLFAAVPPQVPLHSRGGGQSGGTSLSRKSSSSLLSKGGGGGGGGGENRTMKTSNESERISIEDFLRLVSSLGLATLGPKATPMPTRLLVEIALASACSEGFVSDDSKLDSPMFSTLSTFSSTSSSTSSSVVSASSSDHLSAENGAIRKRSFLTFPQFLLALGRLAMQLTDLFLDVSSPLSSKKERFDQVPPILRVKALLQQAASTPPSTSFTDDATAVDLVHQSSFLLRTALANSQTQDERVSLDYIGLVYDLSKKLSIQSNSHRGRNAASLSSVSTNEEEKKGDENTISVSSKVSSLKSREETFDSYNSKVSRFVEGKPLPTLTENALFPVTTSNSASILVINQADPPPPIRSHTRVYKKALPSTQAAKKRTIIAPPVFSPRPSSKQTSDDIVFEERRLKLFQLEQLWQFQRQMNDVEKYLLAQRKAEAKAVSDYNRAQGHIPHQSFNPTAAEAVFGSPRSPSHVGMNGEEKSIGFATRSSADTEGTQTEDARLSKLKRQMLISADVERRHALWAKLLQQREATQHAIANALVVPPMRQTDTDEEPLTSIRASGTGINDNGSTIDISPDRPGSIRTSASGISPTMKTITVTGGGGGGGSSGSLVGEIHDGTSPTKSEIIRADLLFAYGGGFLQHVKKQQQQQITALPPNIMIPKDASPSSQPDTRPATPSQILASHSLQMSITPTFYGSSLRTASVPPSPSASATSSSSSLVGTNPSLRAGVGIAPSRSPVSSMASSINTGGTSRGGGGLKKSASSVSISMMTSSPAPSPPASNSSSLPPISKATAMTSVLPSSGKGQMRPEDASSPTTSTSSTTILAASSHVSNTTMTSIHVDNVPKVVEGSLPLTLSESSISAKVPIVAALGEAPSEPVLQHPTSPSKTSPSSVSPPSPKVSSASINNSSTLLTQHHSLVTAALEAQRQESRSSPSMATNFSSAEEDEDDDNSSATEEVTHAGAQAQVRSHRPDFETSGSITVRGNEQERHLSNDAAFVSTTTSSASARSEIQTRDSQVGSVSTISTSGFPNSSRSDSSQSQMVRPVASTLSSSSSTLSPTSSSSLIVPSPTSTAFSPVISKIVSPILSISTTSSGDSTLMSVTSLPTTSQTLQSITSSQGQMIQQTQTQNNSTNNQSGKQRSQGGNGNAINSVISPIVNTNTGKAITTQLSSSIISDGGGGDESGAQSREILAKRLVLKRMMQTGAIFLKFGRQGFPHSRIIWLTEDLSAIRWRKPGTPMPDLSSMSSRDLTASDSGILVNDISDILKGSITEGAPQTAVFKRNAARVTNGALCLSLVTKSGTRTLDLECESVTMADDWALGLLSLKRYRSLL